jgi:hypothetical protein
MKWIKRLFLVVAFLLLGGVIFSAVSWHLMHGEPEWYQPEAMSPVEREEHAARAEDKFKVTSSALDRFYARERGNARNPHNALPNEPDPIYLEITAAELNSLFLKWAEQYNWEERYGDSLADPRLHLHRGRIILAGTFIDIQSIVSLHYEPQMDEQGRLDMKLHRVMAGRLPLPQSLWNRGRDSLTRSLERKLPTLQQQARISADGSSNEPAIQAAFSLLLLHVLHQEAGDPVIFIPLDNRYVPVRLGEVRVEQQNLHVTLLPLSHEQREDFLHQLRQPYSFARLKR